MKADLPKLQKKRILEFIKEGKRFDGRKLDQFRDMEVEIGISQNAEGSCSVKCGKTEVWAGVKMGISTPYPDHEKEGTLTTTVELGAMADENFDMGAPGINAIEMGRVIDRGIRESGFVDFEKLCIKEGEKVWGISLDIYAINNDGNLFDVAGLAALIALANAKLPVYNETTGKPEHKLSDKSLPLSKQDMSFNLTVYKLGNSLLLNPTREEEEVSEYRLSLALADNDGEPRITAMQKGKEGAISEADMEAILTLVEAKFGELFKQFSKLIWRK